jgi:hypothetical protein
MVMEVNDFLEHFGVKGMRWGVRRAQKRAAKADKKWEDKVLGRGGLSLTAREYVEVHNMAADKANRIDVPRINNKSEYKNLDFTKDSPLRRKYYKEHETSFNNRLRDAMLEKYGTSPSGLKQIKIENGTARIVDVQHASDPFKVVLKLSDDGHILAFEIVATSIEQSNFVDDFLEHHGVKGMKWGVRKSRGGVKTAKKTSADYRKAQELKKKGIPALTNKQLKTVNERMNLEQNFSRMNPTKLQKGHKKVAAILAAGATINGAIAFANSPTGKAVAKTFAKKKAA